jgi:hypothetical protein
LDSCLGQKPFAKVGDLDPKIAALKDILFADDNEKTADDIQTEIINKKKFKFKKHKRIV